MVSNVINALSKAILFLADPWITLPRKHSALLKQKYDELFRYLAAAVLIAWGIAYLAFHLSFDLNKTNMMIWRTFRISLFVFLTVSGLVSLSNKAPIKFVKSLLLVSALATGYLQGWQITLGYPSRAKWILIIPFCLLVPFTRSAFVISGFLGLLLFSTYGYWNGTETFSFVISDYILYCVISVVCGFFWYLWGKNQSLSFEKDFLTKEKIENQISHRRELEKFISPFILNSIASKKITDSQSMAIEVDTFLRRRYQNIVVFYSDLRAFSLRADNKEFIEKELIPSSSKMMEKAEDLNGLARQIGDAIFVSFWEQDEKKLIQSSLELAFFSAKTEWQRVKDLGREKPERNFILSYGYAYVGNMINAKSVNPSVVGKPANLPSRLDEALKNSVLKKMVEESPMIVMSKDFYEKAVELDLVDKLRIRKIVLKDLNIVIRTYEEQEVLYFYEVKEGSGLINEQAA